MGTTTCDECGIELTDVNIWPFCRGDATKHARVEHFSDDSIASYIDMNLGPQDVEITTRGQRRKLMREQGLEFKDVSRKARGKRLYFDMGRA